MEFSQDDFDRLLRFEHARKSAEATYAKDPLDADVSTIYSLYDALFRLISYMLAITLIFFLLTIDVLSLWLVIC